jgi:hypothetical protein
MNDLTIELLCCEANIFSDAESSHNEPSLFGVTDGKAVGTYLEHKFKDFLSRKYSFSSGNSASGIDFPDLGVDMKVTSIKQPQSSCPYKSARQKIFGLGYSLIVFVYDKTDDPNSKTGSLNITDTVFVDSSSTADYQMTKGIRQILMNNGNLDDLMAFMYEKNLPADEIEIKQIAELLLKHPPSQGYLTISNALQWRLQYSRVIELAGKTDGIFSVYRNK